MMKKILNQEEFRQFVKHFIEKHSPYKLRDMVTVVFYSLKRPYEITRISLSEDGEIMYHLTSPRSHESLPKSFKISELELFKEKEENSD
jgi:hypothetical protein